MKQLTVVAKITAITGKEKVLKEALTALIPITLKEEGCINYDLHVSTENDGVFLFYENWKSHELWQNHMNNNHLKTFIAKMPEIVDGDIDLSTWYIN
ncbi:putative quinol monooxygenase [Flagellimonas sp. CMM7]|uniref:putative quinol monooxygenase n=1 Tax=Flagellimonas sp. CMM7 TaxID=2654676 RepID=UPI0013D2AFF3|nr:putative quinol monooxygenase [Flagellimonas sp. CMM7]UII80264.1 antibiotic biosynthesis monooxygenase [Flagellimonas sp. CMM7]